MSPPDSSAGGAAAGTSGATADASQAAPRIALVTGAARRIGRAIALGLAARGWDIAVHWHDSADAAHEVVREVEALGRRAIALRADLGNETETARLVPDCIR